MCESPNRFIMICTFDTRRYVLIRVFGSNVQFIHINLPKWNHNEIANAKRAMLRTSLGRLALRFDFNILFFCCLFVFFPSSFIREKKNNKLNWTRFLLTPHRECSQMETLFQWIKNGNQEIIFWTRHWCVVQRSEKLIHLANYHLHYFISHSVCIEKTNAFDSPFLCVGFSFLYMQQFKRCMNTSGGSRLIVQRLCLVFSLVRSLTLAFSTSCCRSLFKTKLTLKSWLNSSSDSNFNGL